MGAASSSGQGGLAGILAHPATWAVAGGLCLMIGTFLPVAHALGRPILLSEFGGVWSLACLAFGLVALVIPMIGIYHFVSKIAALVLVMLVIRLLYIWTKLDDFGGRTAMLSEAFSDIIVMPATDQGLSYGWLVLLAGPILMLTSAWKASHGGYE